MVIDKVNYVRSLEFDVHDSPKTTTFQLSMETIFQPSVPNWRRRNEEDSGALYHKHFR